jgi:hypothetical protein
MLRPRWPRRETWIWWMAVAEEAKAGHAPTSSSSRRLPQASAIERGSEIALAQRFAVDEDDALAWHAASRQQGGQRHADRPGAADGDVGV